MKTVEPPRAVDPAPDPLAEAEEIPFAEYVHRKWWARTRLPWTLWSYLALEITRVVLLTILTVSLLYTAIAAYQTVRGGIQLAYIWPFLAKTIAYPLYFSIPLSLLFGTTLAIGRMASDLEIAAMRSHGASQLQLFAPIAALALLGIIAGAHVNGEVIPELRYEKRNLQRYVLEQLQNLGKGRNRAIPLPDDGGSILVGAYDGTDLWKVEVDLHRSMQSRFLPEIRDQLPQRLPDTVTLLARMGRLEIHPDHEGVIIHLRGVEVLAPEKTKNGERFIQHLQVEELSVPLTFERRERGIKDLVDADLAAEIDRLDLILEATPDDERIAERRDIASAEWHRRRTFTYSSMTFPLIGACLCLLLDRRSRLVPFLAGNLVVLSTFFPLLMVGSSLGERGFAPWLALALPNLALLGFGAWLVRKVWRQ